MVRTAIWLGLSITLVVGCSRSPKPRPLTSDSFVTPAGAVTSPRATTSPTPANPVAVTKTDPVATTPAPATRPAATSPAIGARSGQYMTIGGVVAEVNGAPIFANKVISMLVGDGITGVIPKKASQLDATRFKASILEDVRSQIGELVREELEYAMAQRSLDEEDRKMADAMTMVWRQQQITKAGGSIELARRYFADRGMEFDDAVKERSRKELIDRYYYKKVYPRILVGANDIREYYEKNRDKEFSVPSKVKIWLVNVSITKSGSKEAAINKVADKYKRAKNGEDFGEMALRENDQKMFASDKPTEINPESFAITKVRQAIEKLQPGQISEIIEEPSGFYIVKLAEKNAGRVQPFEEQAVQEKIRFTLRSQQNRELREQERIKLLKSAVIRSDEAMMQTALEMAMQEYAVYAKK